MPTTSTSSSFSVHPRTNTNTCNRYFVLLRSHCHTWVSFQFLPFQIALYYFGTFPFVCSFVPRSVIGIIFFCAPLQIFHSVIILYFVFVVDLWQVMGIWYKGFSHEPMNDIFALFYLYAGIAVTFIGCQYSSLAKLPT